VSFNYRFTVAPTGTSTNAFRVGVFNTGTTAYASDGDINSFSDNNGYLTRFGAAVSGSSLELRLRTTVASATYTGVNTTSSLLGGTNNFIAGQTQGTFVASGTSSHLFTMTFTRTATSIVITSMQDGGTAASASVLLSDSAVITSFNEFGLRPEITNTLLIDNFNVTSSAAIPEPSAFAALAGLAAVGCAATRRRRRN
jgi:hypothetical protein